jgi:hypothetical protein
MDENKNSQSNSSTGFGFHGQHQVNLPNASTVLLMGILSIVFSFWYFSLVGIIFGFIALVKASGDLKLYAQNPTMYSLSSYNNIKAGRVCAIIGIVVAAIFILFFFLIIIGLVATIPFWGMID